MKKHAGAAPAAAVLAAALLLAGCDSFSIPDRLSLPDTGTDQDGNDGQDTGDDDSGDDSDDGAPEVLSLTVDKETTLRGGTVGMNPSGGSEPYSFTFVEDGLYSETDEEPQGTISGTNYVAGNAIGRFKLTVTDAAGDQADAYVTVVPPAPTITSVEQQGTAADFNFKWTFADETIIDYFRLQYSDDNSEFASLATLSRDIREKTLQTGLNVSIHYTFRIYAVSGSYLSHPYDIEW